MRTVGLRTSLFALGMGSIALGITILISGCSSGESSTLQDKVQIGKALFNMASLSEPGGQSCASCHQPSIAFVDPRQDSPTSEGAVVGRFGKRQAPTLAYMAFSPKFHFDATEQDYIGGQFWDGRAADLKDQVHFPILNIAEMNNTTKTAVITKIAASSLANSLKQLYGSTLFDNTDRAFDAIADAIAAFEASPQFSPFTSKYDAYLKGSVTLTATEARGLALYKGKAKCANCHPSDPGADGTPPLFTDFTYDNIGLPQNTQNRFLVMPSQINPDGASFVDTGLMQTTKRTEDAGRMKVPTLRNVAITPPYFHNGVFKTLEQAVQFYNKRDIVGAFLPPELPNTMNREELGDLKLTDTEVAEIVAFLKTLTDGYASK